ncbi:cysteine desulfurase family protein [Roseovarius sp.]|uniref:cysteine desulfurase family protein n=1 Tax=Roseovarius sp. TaxID=1486281 RepID=UPI003A984A9A
MKIGNTLYFDHQATTPLDSRVFEAMRPYSADSFGNPHASEHIIGWRAGQAVERAAGDIASMIGGESDEIIFTSGATEANNLALIGLAKRAAHSHKRRILLGATEHKCVLEIGRVLADDLGFSVSHIPVDRFGRIDLDVLEGSLGDDVLLLSVMAANNEIGTLQDIPTIARMAARHGSLLHCDAAQAPGAFDLSLLAQNADMISFSAHKMYGPMGIGALFVRRELQREIAPVIHGGGQQNGLRSGTVPTALCVGFGAAARLFAEEHCADDRATLAHLRDDFLRKLETLPVQIWVNGPVDFSQRHPGNINVGFKGIAAQDLLSRMQPQLAASTGSACTSGIPEPSHVLRAIGLSEEDAASSIRFSLGRYTTCDDVDEAVAVISAAVSDISGTGLLEAG